MELLAPAGNEENFHVALESGADAVYIGAPRFNARSLARDLSIEALIGMTRFAHERGKKVYVALNSLVRESDFPDLLRLLVRLETEPPDALIVQDLGVARIVGDFFPHLRLHASTLMTAHNRESLRTYSSLGFSQVVAARELTLAELSNMTAERSVGVEVFVHGAMCFSYSGLCMFSSYFGGKSSLRGKCVQPCRRKFSSGPSRGRQGRTRSGYLFSMNDLRGLEFVPELRQRGVVSLKIEGRLRSATYVGNVVKGYRMVMDADPDSFDAALSEASGLLESAMGRKSATGYFQTPRPKDTVAVHHSGNIGIHLGRITSLTQRGPKVFGSLVLKNPCEEGDRLRVHYEKSGERISFTLTEMVFQGTRVSRAVPPQKIEILLPDSSRSEGRNTMVEVYLVDVKSRTTTSKRVKLKSRRQDRSGQKSKAANRRYKELERAILLGPDLSRQNKNTPSPQSRSRRDSAEIWLRYDSVNLILERLPFSPDRHVINLNKQAMSSLGKVKNYLKRGIRSVIWALPPVVHDAQVGELRKQLRVLIKSGFRSFTIGHLSQADLFGREKVYLYGDYSLNLLNSQALEVTASKGLKGVQLCMEADRTTLSAAVEGFRQSGRARGVLLGLTVFGCPPLFTSRLAADHFTYGKTILSPKNEPFVIEKRTGYTQTRPTKPFSLLPYRRELETMGLDYLVVDLSGMKTGRKELDEVARHIARSPKTPRLPTFNFLGSLE